MAQQCDRQNVRRETSAIFVMIGADPNTGWLGGIAKLDDKGFVLTGGVHGFDSSPYATSEPGLFAVGDVRADSVKRIASAVGEGSVVISYIHRYLATRHDHFLHAPGSTLAAARVASTPDS